MQWNFTIVALEEGMMQEVVARASEAGVAKSAVPRRLSPRAIPVRTPRNGKKMPASRGSDVREGVFTGERVARDMAPRRWIGCSGTNRQTKALPETPVL